MRLNERQKVILNRLKAHRQVKVTALAQELFVSEMTVRRDLKAMEKAGLLKRCHGGAIKIETDLLYPIKMRMHLNSKEKTDLAQRAKKYLKDDQVIFLSSSSTCAYLCPYLKEFKNIRVVTNSIHVLASLSNLHVPCILTGGVYQENERSLLGRFAEQVLREINTDIAFISCEGISENGQFTDSSSDLAELAKIAIKNTKTKIFLMDNSKLNTKCTYNICSLDDVDELIIV